MKPQSRIILIILLLCIAGPIAAQNRAVLRRDSDTKYRVEVSVKATADPTKPVLAALNVVDDEGNRKQLQKFEQKLPAAPSTVFSIDMPVIPDDDSAYIVSIFEFPTADGVFNYDLPVGKMLTTQILSSDKTCSNGLRVDLNSKDYSPRDWQDIVDWVNRFGKGIATVKITVGASQSAYPIRSAAVLTDPADAVYGERMLLCLVLEPTLPSEDFDAEVTFNNAPKSDLQKPITETGLQGAPIPATPTIGDDNGVPAQRGLERNLDLGISFSSSVGEKTADDGSTFIGRTNRGTFDIRLAPLLKTQGNKPFDRDQKWYRYFTPIFLDAAVSTGKIDEDTLSMNRVILGTEFEWRYYDFRKREGTNDTKTDAYVTFHRFILSGNHASDRDFKQKEFLGSFEYQPVIGFLNHPLYLNWKIENGVKTPDDHGFGYEIIPRFGFTIGKTYQRRNPAAAIQPSETARRFHVGLDMTFNFTRYVQLSVKDTLYVRGEAPDDRIHNYFKGTIEAPLGRPFSKSVNSLFMSFERGNQPPFATRDANVFKIGYRIRSEGWFDRLR